MKRSVVAALAAVVTFVASHGSAVADSWDMPTPYGDSNFHTANIIEFAREVDERTGGALTIQVHSAGSLVKHPEIISAVRRGIVPIGELLISRLANEDAVFEVDSVPFLAAGYDDARSLWDASRPVIERRLAERGLTLLFAVPWPPQGLYTNTALTSADGLKGLRMRAYNTSTERLAQLSGAIPTQIEVPDIPTAFSTGRVDAMITSPSTGADTKAWDYLTHFTHIQAWLPKNMVVANTRALQRLDEPVRSAVLEAAENAEARGWEASERETREKIDVMKANGLVVEEPTEALRSALREIGKTMASEWLDRAGDDGDAILAAYRQ